jgi:hypothetical protein
LEILDNPAAVVARAAAAGLAAGLAIPETEIERQKLKPHAQPARQQVEGKVKETVGQVKSGVQDAVDSTADAVREQAPAAGWQGLRGRREGRRQDPGQGQSRQLVIRRNVACTPVGAGDAGVGGIGNARCA